MASVDRFETEYWRNLAEGAYLTLRDFQSLEAYGNDGATYTIGEHKVVEIAGAEGDSVYATYHIYEAIEDGEEIICYFVVVDLGETFELRFYFVPDGYAVGSREEIIDNGMTWLFLPPENPDDFVAADLELAEYPGTPAVEEMGEIKTPEFRMKGKPVYAKYEATIENEDRIVPVMLTEYETGDQTQNPLLLVFEEAWMDQAGQVCEEGGFVTAMLGCTVGPDEVETIS